MIYFPTSKIYQKACVGPPRNLFFFSNKKIRGQRCITKLVKASDEFVRNLFIQDQIKSSGSNILCFILIHVENVNANFKPIFLVNEPEKNLNYVRLSLIQIRFPVNVQPKGQ